jgi:serine/threonine protein kinase
MTESSQGPAASEEDLLDRLAAQLADGSAIDWEEFRAQGISEKQIRAFRTLAMLRTAPPESDDEAEPDVPHGYEILGVAGRGGYARVLKARDKTLGRTVALKVLDPVLGATEADRQRFLREARTMAQVEHPNVLRIFGLHTTPAKQGPPHIALALEWIDGEDLGRSVERRGPLHPVEAIRIGIDLCDALQTLHEHGVVHRDVKPQNVMRRRGGTTVLLDFGIARRITDEEVVLGSTAGTPAFEAPEVLGGGLPTPSSDVFSVGVLLYWLMTGMLPVPGTTATEQRQATREGRFVPLWQCRTDVPRPISDAVEAAMALHPATRPATAADLANTLRRALAEACNAPDLHRQGRSRRQATIGVLGALALGVSFGLGATLGPSPAASTPPGTSIAEIEIDRAADAHEWIRYGDDAPTPRSVLPRQLADGAYDFVVPYDIPSGAPPEGRRDLRCPEDYATIQAAIDASAPGDRVIVGAGTWKEALQITAHPIELCSRDGPRVTNIDATGLDAAVISSAGLETAYEEGPSWGDVPLVIRGFSIYGGTGTKGKTNDGNADRYGGGIHLSAVPARIEHCVVFGNGIDQPTTFGGGMLLGGTVTVRDCVVLGNAAWACAGGLFSLGEKAEVRVERCTIVGNTGRNLFGIQGGVAASHGGEVYLDRCIVWGNRGEQLGTFGSYEQGAIREATDSILGGTSSRAPQFVDFRTGDLRLRRGSVGVDADGNATHGALRAR